MNVYAHVVACACAYVHPHFSLFRLQNTKPEMKMVLDSFLIIAAYFQLKKKISTCRSHYEDFESSKLVDNVV